jgi:hypothetical protein
MLEISPDSMAHEKGGREELDAFLKCASDGQRKRNQWAERHPEMRETLHKEPRVGLGLWRSIFGWDALFRWDVLAAIVPGVFLAIGCAMLGVDWFPNRLLIAQICFGLAGSLLVIKLLGYAKNAKGGRFSKVAFCILWCGSALFISSYAIYAIQIHKKFTPSIAFSIFESLGHQKDSLVGGHAWVDKFRDIRITIDNTSEYPVKDIDLSIQVLKNSGDTLGEVSQLTDIPGVTFIPPQFPDTSLKIRGTDGNDYVLSPRDIPTNVHFGNEWKMVCPLLPRGPQIRLVVPAIHEPGDSAPQKLRLVGSYESGNNAYSFDRTLDVGTAQVYAVNLSSQLER